MRVLIHAVHNLICSLLFIEAFPMSSLIKLFPCPYLECDWFLKMFQSVIILWRNKYKICRFMGHVQKSCHLFSKADCTGNNKLINFKPLSTVYWFAINVLTIKRRKEIINFSGKPTLLQECKPVWPKSDLLNYLNNDTFSLFY